MNVSSCGTSRNLFAARWVTFPDESARRKFENEEAARLARDIDGNPVYLAPTRVNLKLTEVISDITGVTGMAIIKAILGGERDCNRLAKLRDPRCKQEEKTIALALEGTWREALGVWGGDGGELVPGEVQVLEAGV